MTLEEYLALPYTINLKRDTEGEYVARIQELRGCVAHGTSELEALQAIRDMQRLWIEASLADGDPVPLPEDTSSLPSGKWLQRVPRTLHLELISCAHKENVSLNQLVVTVLAKYVGVQSREQDCSQVSSINAQQDRPVNAIFDPWSEPLRHLVTNWVVNTAPLASSLDPTGYLETLAKNVGKNMYELPHVEVGDRGEAKHNRWN